MRGAILALASLVAFLVACDPPMETQTRIWAGIRLDQPCNVKSWIGEMKEIPHSGIHGIMLELEVDPASSAAAGYLYYLPHPMDSVVFRLKKLDIPYGIRISLVHDSIPVSSDRLDDWLTDLSGLLLRTSKFPPEWLLFDGPWTRAEWHENALAFYLKTIRTGWKEFDGEIWYTGTPERTSDTTAVELQPDAWIGQMEGFVSRKSVLDHRAAMSQDSTTTHPYRMLSIAPAWSGFLWRVSPWIRKGPQWAEPTDLLVTGETCGLLPTEDDIDKLTDIRTGED